MTFLFQAAVLAFIALSFALVVGVPFTFALPDGWVNGRGLIFFWSRSMATSSIRSRWS